MDSEENPVKATDQAGFKAPLAPPTKASLQAQVVAKPQASASPAEVIYKNKAFAVPYLEPNWSGHPPESGYTLEEIKTGTIANVHKLSGKSHFLVGRLPGCDITLEHPSLSRFHAILQYRSESSGDTPAGFYLYDLESTHGTFHNKNRCFPKTYYRLRVGHTLKFGCSTRLLILQGPPDDMDEESDLSVTELKAIASVRAKKKAEDEENAAKRSSKESGISWGISDDAEDERKTNPDEEDEVMPDMENNPFAVTGDGRHEKLYSSDPKKFLKSWFEKEGYTDLDFECTEKGFASFHCKIELPIDVMGTGETVVVAEVTHKGKKKDAIAQCALEACRLLDKYGVLSSSQSAQESAEAKKVRKWEENDYYSSDEDEYLDRTKAIQDKREKRMKMAQKSKPEETRVETFESLSAKQSAISKEISQAEQTLKDAQESLSVAKTLKKTDNDDLDEYMEALSKSGKGENATRENISKLKQSINKLKLDLEAVNKLLDLARPTPLPSLVSKSHSDVVTAKSSKFSGIMVGRRKGSGVVTTLRKLEASPLNRTKEIPSPKVQLGKEDESQLTIEPHKKEELQKPDHPKATEVTPKPVIPRVKEVFQKPVNPKAKTPKPEMKIQRIETNSPPPEVVRPDSESDEDMEEFEDEVWLPPKDQTGDGKTSLNEKYGY